MTKKVHKGLVVRFGQWLTYQPGSHLTSALKLVECARAESGIIGARIEAAINNSDLLLRQGLIEKMKAEFSQAEVEHLLTIDREGPYEWD